MTVKSYGLCPICGAPGKFRERRPWGNDICEAGHSYPSAQAWVPTHKHRQAKSYVRVLHDDTKYASTSEAVIVYEDRNKSKWVRSRNTFEAQFEAL